MIYPRLYTDLDGESHFADVDVVLTQAEFVPGRPVVNLSTPTPSVANHFLSVSADWDGDWHPTPRRQLIVGLEGELHITASDGEMRRLPPGAVILLEDIGGKGHHTHIHGERWTGLFVWLAE